MFQPEQKLVDYHTQVTLLGVPPLLGSETQSSFQRLFESLSETFRPLDFNMQRLTYGYALEINFEMRMRRFQSLLLREASDVHHTGSPSEEKELLAAKAFEKRMKPYESFGMLIDQHSKRAAAIYRQIEWCREAAAIRAKRIADMEHEQWRREEMEREKAQALKRITEES